MSSSGASRWAWGQVGRGQLLDGHGDAVAFLGGEMVVVVFGSGVDVEFDPLHSAIDIFNRSVEGT